MRKETNQNMIPKNAAWQCVGCKKHIKFTVTCKVYPKGIPSGIKHGETMCKEREVLEK